MARVMICDDDPAMTDQLVLALRAARHEAITCRHTMDVLRETSRSRFDLIAFGLDVAESGGASLLDAIHELAPGVPLIAIHRRPSEIMRTAAHAHLAAVLPRPVPVTTFMYAVARALEARALRASSTL